MKRDDGRSIHWFRNCLRNTTASPFTSLVTPAAEMRSRLARHVGVQRRIGDPGLPGDCYISTVNGGQSGSSDVIVNQQRVFKARVQQGRPRPPQRFDDGCFRQHKVCFLESSAEIHASHKSLIGSHPQTTRFFHSHCKYTQNSIFDNRNGEAGMLLLKKTKKNPTGFTDCDFILKYLPTSLWQREEYCPAVTKRTSGF